MPVPIISAQTVNPIITSVDTSSSQQVANAWFNEWPAFPAERFINKMGSSALVDMIPIPLAPQLPRQYVAGTSKRGKTLAIGSMAMIRKNFEYTIEVNKREYNGSPQARAVYDMQIQAISSPAYKAMHQSRLCMQALATNPVRTYHDGQAFFASTHPISWINTSQKAQVAGLPTTQSNLFTSSAFSLQNLAANLGKMFLWTPESGEPLRIRDITVAVQTGDYLKACQAIDGALQGFGSVYGSSDMVGTNSNVLNPFRDKGFKIDVVMLDQYTGTSTDWFIFNNSLKPFEMRVGSDYEYYDLTSRQDGVVMFADADYHIVLADMSFDLAPVWWAAAKCTA